MLRAKLNDQAEEVEERARLEAEKQRKRIEKEAQSRAEKVVAAEIQTQADEIEGLRAKVGAANKQQAELKRRERDLKEKRAALTLELETRLGVERETIRAAVREQVLAEVKKAATDQSAELERLQGQLEAQESLIEEARKARLEAAKKELALKRQAAELDLRVLEEVNKKEEEIRGEARRKADEAHRLRDLEKDKKITDLVVQLDEMKRRAERGSQQLQGEVLELELQGLLTQAFRFDSIEPVPKGVEGGDVVQRVRDSSGADCGVILWESKRTKSWSEKWLPKLRDDQRAVKADQAVLVSSALPTHVRTFDLVDAVWVTSWDCAISVATSLRVGMLEVAKAKRAIEGQQGKKEILFAYLTGPEFRNRMTGLVEAFMTLQRDLDDEKRSMQRIWAKREKQIQRAMLSGTGLYGDLQGVIGKSLPAIETLELPAGEDVEPGDDRQAGPRPLAAGGQARGRQDGGPSEELVDRVVGYLERTPGSHGRADLTATLQLDDREWAGVASALGTDDRVIRTGHRRGTRYQFRR